NHNNQSLTIFTTADENGSVSMHDTGNEITGEYTVHENQTDLVTRHELDLNQGLIVTTDELDSITTSLFTTGNTFTGLATTHTTTSAPTSLTMTKTDIALQFTPRHETEFSGSSVSETSYEYTGDHTITELSSITITGSEADRNGSLSNDQVFSTSTSVSM